MQNRMNVPYDVDYAPQHPCCVCGLMVYRSAVITADKRKAICLDCFEYRGAEYRELLSDINEQDDN